MEASIATVRSLCEQIDADLIWLRERTDTGGKIQDYLIRQRVGEQDFLEVRWSKRSGLHSCHAITNCCCVTACCV